MTTMRVLPMAPGEFGVEVTEGHELTGHKVRLPPAFLDDVRRYFPEFAEELQRRLA